MDHEPYKSIYIHMPFCKSRCSYCDFHSRVIEPCSDEIDKYVEDMVLNIRRLSKEGELSEIESVYIGGGTPSYAGTKALCAILYTLGISMSLTDDVECTVEANPDSLDERLVKDIFSLGANRISIGVQTFDDGLLRLLGRAHDAEQAKRAIRAASTRFQNISIDLICGIPGQTLAQFEKDLDQAIALGVKHVSIYPLTIEPGTELDRLVESGKIEPASDDEQADMMELAANKLADAGFRRYEVANYAIPGFESAHNSGYWKGRPYLGLGESAVTMMQGQDERIRLQDGLVIDDLDMKQMRAEDLMLAMRMSTGLSDAMVRDSLDLLPDLLNTLERLSGWGLVEHDEKGWHPTDKGWLCGNELYGELLELAP